MEYVGRTTFFIQVRNIMDIPIILETCEIAQNN